MKSTHLAWDYSLGEEALMLLACALTREDESAAEEAKAERAVLTFEELLEPYARVNILTPTEFILGKTIPFILIAQAQKGKEDPVAALQAAVEKLDKIIQEQKETREKTEEKEAKKETEKLPELEYPDDYELRRVQRNGTIRWRSDSVLLTPCLESETVGLHEVDRGDLAVGEAGEHRQAPLPRPGRPGRRRHERQLGTGAPV